MEIFPQVLYYVIFQVLFSKYYMNICIIIIYKKFI